MIERKMKDTDCRQMYLGKSRYTCLRGFLSGTVEGKCPYITRNGCKLAGAKEGPRIRFKKKGGKNE